MKKVLAILVVLLMVPFVSMAATMSDADLAAVTGQSGVTIGIGSVTVGVSFGSLTWGDYDGFTNASTSAYVDAGYVNILAYPVPMHITISNLTMTIDVGTDTANSVTAIQIGISDTTVLLDAFVADIVLDGTNGAVADYAQLNSYASATGVYSYEFSELYEVETGTLARQDYSKVLGVFGISRVVLDIPALNIMISAH